MPGWPFPSFVVLENYFSGPDQKKHKDIEYLGGCWGPKAMVLRCNSEHKKSLKWREVVFQETVHLWVRVYMSEEMFIYLIS